MTVQYDVTPQGQVVNAQVVASEPPGLFDAAALEAVGSWRFRPQVRNGQIESVVGLISSLEFRAFLIDAKHSEEEMMRVTNSTVNYVILTLAVLVLPRRLQWRLVSQVQTFWPTISVTCCADH